MKTLKITLITALFFASLTSCTKQDLNEGDIQNDSNNTVSRNLPVTGGVVQD
ncbi:MAG: hypothetical protein P8K68_05645 [Algibacter sp.]|uniref:hypothetical protein n=1 Tax=Algibacter sp. TaxID=1872428 RepID=UPI0026273EE2|nr:hypothetical protein [Algibacter sp.]MDG1728302.1 hypothetical protein [Algibacter sp.]MDG2178260.1 hypothetical protein [Algibacter sp.]